MLHSFSTKVVSCWNKVKIRYFTMKNVCTNIIKWNIGKPYFCLIFFYKQP